MRDDVEEAINEACEQYLGDKIVGKPVRIRGQNVRRHFVRRLKFMLQELPEEMSVRELLNEITE